jgi:hypothetical protein
MQWRVSIFVNSVLCPWGILYHNGQVFLEIWEIFCYYFVEYSMYSFGFYLFCSLSVICRFGLLIELLCSWKFLSQLLCLLCKSCSVFFFNMYFVSSPLILTSTCSSLLECFPLYS